jgi:hypothetical protein
MPPGGLVLPWPYPGKPLGMASLNGKSMNWRDGEIVIRSLPVVLRLPRPGAGSTP